MITAYTLSNNKIQALNPKELADGKLTWVRSVSPDENEIKKLAEISNIPIHELTESSQEDERPRLTKKRYMELIYSVPHIYKEEGLQTQEIYFYLAKNLVITIENEKTRVLEKIERKCKKNRAKFIFKSPGTFLFQALDEINDDFLAFIDKTATTIESTKITDLKKINFVDLYSKSITFAYFNQALVANLEVLNQLKKSHHRTFTSQDRQNFAELYYDKLQILDTEKIQRELIMNLIDIKTISSTEKLNLTIKRLTSLALLIAVPTLISSAYGMNVDLPLQNDPYAFYYLAGIMIIFSLGLFSVMKLYDWI
ncbi:MAG: magnesium transporter CorA family protein [Nanoarchaeota archaeon]